MVQPSTAPTIKVVVVQAENVQCTDDSVIDPKLYWAGWEWDCYGTTYWWHMLEWHSILIIHTWMAQHTDWWHTLEWHSILIIHTWMAQHTDNTHLKVIDGGSTHKHLTSESEQITHCLVFKFGTHLRWMPVFQMEMRGSKKSCTHCSINKELWFTGYCCCCQCS